MHAMFYQILAQSTQPTTIPASNFDGFAWVSGAAKFALGLATSWPLFVTVAIIILRKPLAALLDALVTRLSNSATVRLPGIEFSDTEKTVTSLTEDILRLKQEVELLRASKSKLEDSKSKIATREETIEQLVHEYDHDTHIPDYAERMRKKTSIETRMERAVKTSIPAPSALLKDDTEGSYLAAVVATSVLPPPEAIDTLINVGRRTKHLYVRNAWLLRFAQLISRGIEPSRQDVEIARGITKSYENDKEHPPDRTFARNLTYFNQLLNNAVVRRIRV